MEKILVIKHGALGDFIQATGALGAIRGHHPKAHITLLTTKPWVGLVKGSPFFDDIVTDARKGIREALQVIRWIRQQRFSLVYDLQNSDRTGWYFRLLWPFQPTWSGLVKGCTYPHRTPHRQQMHTVDRLAEQLQLAGIADVPAPNLDWLHSGTVPDVPERFALLVPGGSPHRPEKRWPGERYAKLARHLVQQGIIPAILGTQADVDNIRPILECVPEAIDLTGKTDFAGIATLGRKALLAVGNDTGPMHILAVAGCACVVLFSNASDPARCAPRGRVVRILRQPDLRDLPVKTVIDAL